MIRLSSPEKKTRKSAFKGTEYSIPAPYVDFRSGKFCEIIILSVHPVLHKPFPQSLAHVPYNNKSLRVIMLHNILHADNIPA